MDNFQKSLQGYLEDSRILVGLACMRISYTDCLGSIHRLYSVSRGYIILSSGKGAVHHFCCAYTESLSLSGSFRAQGPCFRGTTRI